MKRTLGLALGLLLLAASSASAQIANSRHDMSFGSTTAGPKATTPTDTQICIFCHTPHHALQQDVIWNHAVSLNATSGWAAGTTRSGTVLPTDLHAASKACITCHDGSVALGEVNNVGGGASGTIATTAPGTMPLAYQVGASGDMTGNHPVSIPYAGEGASNAVADGTVGNYYATTTASCENGGTCTAGPSGASINLIVNGAEADVECGSCHEPHNKYANNYFLRVSESGSAICLACHNK